MPDVRLIDANELLRVIDEEIEYGAEYAATNYQLINKGLKIARKDIKCAPTIDAQPVKLGRWIECDSQPNQKMCSSCRGVGVAKDIAQFFTYCPFCGAFMRGDKDGR